MGLSHLASLLISALVVYVLGWRMWPMGKPESPWIRALSFAVVVLLVAFFRGSVIGWMMEIDRCPTLLLMTAGSAIAYSLLGIWLCLGFRNAPASSQQNPDFWGRWTLAFILYAVALRVVYLGLPELLHEEAYYWNYAMHPALGYLDHPPMVGWLIWLFTTLFGHTELTVRLGALLTWFVGAYFVFRLARTLFDRTTGAVAVLLFAILPVYYIFGFVMLPDAPLTACWAGALFCFHRVFILEKRSAWLGLGLFMGLGMLSKYTVALLGFAALLFLLWDPKARKWLKTPYPYLSVLLALLLFGPVLIWNYQNDWASFVYQGPQRVSSAYDFDTPALFGSIFILITPIGLLSVLALVFGKREWKAAITGVEKEDASRTLRLFLVLTLVPFSVFLFFSFFHTIKLNWTGPLWLGILPLVARIVTYPPTPQTSRLGRWARASWPATVISLLVLLAAVMHYIVLGLLRLPYPHNQIGFGWPDLGIRFQKIVRNVERETGQRPLVVGMDTDFLSGWLAFYRSRAMAMATGKNMGAGALDTAGPHLFGYDSHMYCFWFPPKEETGKTMLLVTERPHDINNEVINGHFERGGPIEEICSYKNEHVTGHFFYRVMYGYRPQ